LFKKDGDKDNFALFELVARQLEVQLFEEKFEQLKTTTNEQGRSWLRGLLRHRETWTRAYDEAGWRYSFQTSNMAESFNSVLKGIRGMPVNAIVEFTFTKLVAMFNSKHEAAIKLQNKGDLLPSKPNEHLNDAKGFAHTHEVRLFDLSTGKYEVTERGGTTSDGEVRAPRKYVVLLSNFSCTCGRPRQYHFPCSHYIAAVRHRNFSYMRSIPPEFTVDKLVQTWSPRFEPFLDESQWPQYTGPVYIADRACRWDKRGSRKRSRHGMAMDQISGRTKKGRARPFVEEPKQNQYGRCSRLGHNSRTCFWTLSQVPINLVYKLYSCYYTNCYH